MATVESDLEALKTAQSKVDTDFAEANKAMQQAQAKVAAANNQRSILAALIASIEKLLGELKAADAAGKAQREKVVADIASAQKAMEELQAKLFTELPEQKRVAITAAVATVDAAIQDAATRAAAADKDVAAAQTALAMAQQTSTAADADLQAAGRELQQFPQQVEAARTRLSKLMADAKAALDAGRVNESFVRFLELRQLLTDLPTLSSKESQDKLVAQVTEKRKAAQTAQEATRSVADKLDKQKAAQAVAQADLKKKQQERDNELKKAMSASGPEESPAAKPAEV